MESASEMHCGRTLLFLIGLAALRAVCAPALCGDDDSGLLQELGERRASLDLKIAENPQDVDLFSARGDVLFFLGEFEPAVRDYSRMVELNPALDSSHWRRGIAWFYAGRYADAARQFERYHSFDNVDRENGIWRYLCQVKAHGVEKARAGLLKYEKDDRQPFPDVYRLFAGDVEPEEILRRIATAKVSDEEREKRLFYAHLYIGLWHAVHDRPLQALPHLEQAVQNTWAPRAGYGPRYMWHVGRLQQQLLAQAHDAGTNRAE
ncbi:MAG: hypothetical protein AB7U20_01460 [Planctomycetaceae bacterium]